METSDLTLQSYFCQRNEIKRNENFQNWSNNCFLLNCIVLISTIVESSTVSFLDVRFSSVFETQKSISFFLFLIRIFYLVLKIDTYHNCSTLNYIDISLLGDNHKKKKTILAQFCPWVWIRFYFFVDIVKYLKCCRHKSVYKNCLTYLQIGYLQLFIIAKKMIS